MSGFVLSAAALSLMALALLLVPLLRTDAAPAEPPRRRLALLVALALPLAAGGGYAYWGAWTGLQAALAQAEAPVAEAGADPSAASAEAAGAAPTAAMAEAMVRRLAQRLKQQPDNAEGWRLLARSYENLGRFADAEQAYRQLERLLPPSADLLTEHAVTLAMSLGQRLSGAPEALIERALALEPRNLQALSLSGSAAFERGDYARAAAVWRQVLEAAGPDQALAASIRESIGKAQAAEAATRGR